MKKLLQITSILVVFIVLFFEVTHVVIVIKYGQGHEITIGRSETIDSIHGKLIPVLNQKSADNNKTFTSSNGKASERHTGIRTVPTLHQSAGSSFFIPWLFEPRLAIGNPSINMGKPNKFDNLRNKAVDQEFDFHQDSESNYAYQQQILFDIQTRSNPTIKSKFTGIDRIEWIEWMVEIIPSNQANNLRRLNEQAGNGNQAIPQQYGIMNVALIQQVGYTNNAIQIQNGVFNISSTLQAGSINLSVQDQHSSFNDAEVSQSGILNNAKQSQNQEMPGSLNKALAYQGGAYNNSIQKQNGTFNQACTIQSGVGNESIQNQAGNLNDALIAQNSIGSIAHQSQNSGHSGSNTGNNAEIYQSSGSGNQAEQNQLNTGEEVIINNTIIRQKGYSNSASQLQTGGNNYSVISQTGSNNKSNVYQIKL